MDMVRRRRRHYPSVLRHRVTALTGAWIDRASRCPVLTIYASARHCGRNATLEPAFLNLQNSKKSISRG